MRRRPALRALARSTRRSRPQDRLEWRARIWEPRRLAAGRRAAESGRRAGGGQRVTRIPVLRELTDAVLLLTLNRAEKKNAFDDAQWDALHDALRDAAQDPKVACAVVTG